MPESLAANSGASAWQIFAYIGEAVAAFAIGSIPFGVIIGRLFYRIDIRASGSGNIGAANALRTFGRVGALSVLVLDALKGFVPVALVMTFGARWGAQAAASVLLLAGIAGFAALLGHCYSPWLRFRGGKGVATHLGVLLALSWPIGLLFIATWAVAALSSGYSSAGSLLATLVSAVGLWLALGPIGLVYGAAAAIIIFWRHRDNLARLRTGSEHRMSLFARGGSGIARSPASPEKTFQAHRRTPPA